MSHTLQLSCPAKVNLALSVGPPDLAGMHPIASWMVAVNFSDAMTLQKLDAGPSQFDLAFESDDAKGQPLGLVDWPLAKDLCFRAHALLRQRAGRDLPCSLTLRKKIPAGAGLGGGSSNAAAALVGLNRLFELGLDRAALVEISRKLGSDIAFFIGAAEREYSAIVTGIGETLEPAPRKDTIDFVLIFPPFGCPTGPVYKAFDEMARATQSPDLARVRELASSPLIAQDAPFNDLAEPACRVRPQLAELRTQVAAALGLPVHITGSGSTLFVIAPSALTSKVLARKVTALTGLRAVATRTL